MSVRSERHVEANARSEGSGRSCRIGKRSSFGRFPMPGIIAPRA